MIVPVLGDARDPWWIIASAAAALHGVHPIEVGDVDVLLSARDARRLLAGIGLKPAPGPVHPDFRSTVFAAWTTPPLTVEFMAGFEHFDGFGWSTVEPETRQTITFDGIDVFVPSRAELRTMMQRFGRPKDLVREQLLANLD